MLFYDDFLNRHYLGRKIFSNSLVNKMTNRLNLGYSQVIIARKIG